MAPITLNGFAAGGICAGIKNWNKKDIGLITAAEPAAVAGVFTQNKIQAAPVLLDKERIRSGRCRAIIVNSGNANCCTGEAGMRDARAMARAAALELGCSEDDVLVASTGVIGLPLPMNIIESAVPDLVKACHPSGVFDFAEAIMTTDTVPKVVHREARIGGKACQVTGVAKGAGMIRPDMATLLAFILTDVSISAERLQSMLAQGVDRSLNCLTIDGDTSTNDTVLAVASGAAGVAIEQPADCDQFAAILGAVLQELARKLVKDGEGVTKLVDIAVKGASSAKEARIVADTVAHSNLVKTAFFGEDANWGRILAAVGRSGVAVAPETIDVYFDDVQMVRNGIGCGAEAETRVAEVLQKDEFGVTIDLNMGQGRSTVLTCDFSVDYVRINADYRT